MRRLLNEHTGTVHKSRRGTTGDEAACGALQHVPRRRVTAIRRDETGDDSETPADGSGDEDVDRCGRCFEGAGGY